MYFIDLIIKEVLFRNKKKDKDYLKNKDFSPTNKEHTIQYFGRTK